MKRYRQRWLLPLAAFLGGLAAAALLLAPLGSPNDSNERTVTTTVRQAAASVSDRSADGADLDPETVYAETAAGVVGITAEGSGEGRPMPPFGGPQSSESTATGSGFVISEDGEIVTAAHVVEGASSILVTFQDGTTREATLVGEDDATDVALIKVDATGLELQALELGSSDSLDVGAEVAAIGSPFGYEGSISTGLVSGLDRSIEAPNGFTVAHAIQTDAAVNPGNSGGPLLDAEGEVVGIVDQIATDGSTEQSSGVGFAVPSDLVASVVESLSRGEEVVHAYLGIASTTSTAVEGSGALVSEVVAASPAAQAGLRQGDVITAVDGTAVDGSDELVGMIAEYEPGEEATVEVQRGTGTVSLTVTFGAQPVESGAQR